MHHFRSWDLQIVFGTGGFFDADDHFEKEYKEATGKEDATIDKQYS